MLTSISRSGRICAFVFLSACLFVDCSKGDGGQAPGQAGNAMASVADLNEARLAFDPQILLGRCAVPPGTSAAPMAVRIHCDRNSSRRAEDLVLMTRGD